MPYQTRLGAPLACYCVAARLLQTLPIEQQLPAHALHPSQTDNKTHLTHERALNSNSNPNSAISALHEYRIPAP